MSRGKWTYDKNTGKIVPFEEKKKENLSAYVQQDSIEPLESMVDGKIYESKSALRAHYKQAGVIEKGNDRNTVPKVHWSQEREYQEKLEEDAVRTWYAVRDGMAPLTELDKERCKIIDHNERHYNYDRRARDEDGNPID